MAMPIHARIQKLRQLPPGRAHQAARNVAQIVYPLGFHQLRPFVDAVRDDARGYIDLRALRFGQTQARGGGAARKIDRACDVRLAFIYDTARRYTVDLPGTAEADAAERLLRRYFPRGLRAVVRAPFEEELIQIEALLDGLAGPDADLPRILTIEHHVVALRELAPQYARALDREERVTPGELAAAWRAVHHAVLELAWAIVVTVRDPDARDRALAPIFDQDDRLAAIYARRQRGETIDEVDLDSEALGLMDDEADGDALDLDPPDAIDEAVAAPADDA